MKIKVEIVKIRKVRKFRKREVSRFTVRMVPTGFDPAAVRVSESEEFLREKLVRGREGVT